MSTNVFTDTFQRANSNAGSPGNGWTDVNGADWYINNLQLNNVSYTLGQTNPRTVVRPSGEVTQNGGKDQAIVGYFLGSNAAVGNPQTDCILAVRVQNSNTFYYVAVSFAQGILKLEKIVSGTNTNPGIQVGFATRNGIVPYIIMLAAQSTDSTHTTITCKIWDATNIATPLATKQWVGETDASLQAAGVVGLNHDYPGVYYRVEEWNYDGTDPTLVAAGVTVPTPVLGSIAQTTANLTVGNASGTVPPYTYQWYRGASPDFTPGAGNILPGQASQTLNDSGLTPGTLYWYKVVVTDSTTPTALTGTSRACGAYTPLGVTASLLGIGDSIMANVPHDSDNELGLGDIHLCLYDPFKATCRYLEKTVVGLRSIVAVNQAHGGASTLDWKPAVSGLAPSGYFVTLGGNNSNLGTGYLYNAIQAAKGASPVPLIALIQLGTNDCKDSIGTSAAVYKQNLGDICNALIGNNITPVINYPTFIQEGADDIWSESAMVRLLSYLPQIDSLVNGTTIRAGDKKAFYYGAMANTTLFEGSSVTTTPNNGVHPNQDGGYAWAEFWGLALGTILSLLIVTGEWVLYGWANEWITPGDAVTEIYPVPSFKGPALPLLLSMVQPEAPGGAPTAQGEWTIRSWPNEWKATAL